MKGSITFNGNIAMETEFIERFQSRILSSNHSDPNIRESQKVLLITAAWQKREFDEKHVQKSLYNIGLKPNFQGNFDQNLQNLSIYHSFNYFKKHEAEIYQTYHSKQKVIKEVKLFYREKNSGLIRILQNQLKLLKSTFRGVTLHKVLSYNIEQAVHELNHWELLYHYACQDIQDTMEKIRQNDDLMLKVCHEIDDYFFESSQVEQNPLYQEIREQLKWNILSSNTIFIFGGHIAVLFNRLNFFRLKEVFEQALALGTNFYTVSAGSLCLCEHIIVFDEDSNEWTKSDRMYDFELFDKGFGLVKKIQLFPHCKDYIYMEDPETVSYLVARFNKSVCVGLDQRSFLMMDTYQEQQAEYERFMSVGQDEGLYIFQANGKVQIKEYGEELVLPGTSMHSS